MKSVQLEVTVTVRPESLATLVDELVRALREGTRAVELAGQRLTNAKTEPPPRPRMTPPVASDRAPFRGTIPPVEYGLLVDTRQVAKMLSVSPRKLWQMYNSGEMPSPIRIGRSVRWNYEELRAWVNAGCPPGDEWRWPQ